MVDQRRGGIIEVKIDGQIIEAKGDFTATFDGEQREDVTGSDTVHGFSGTPTPGKIAGKMTDRKDLDLKKIFAITNATVTMLAANGKQFVLRNAWYSGDRTVNSKEGEVDLAFTGLSLDEI